MPDLYTQNNVHIAKEKTIAIIEKLQASLKKLAKKSKKAGKY